MCCDNTIYIVNIYETTLTTKYVHYVLEHKLCASVQSSVNLTKVANYAWWLTGIVELLRSTETMNFKYEVQTFRSEDLHQWNYNLVTVYIQVVM